MATIAERIAELERRLEKLRAKKDLLEQEIHEVEGDISALSRVEGRKLLDETSADPVDEFLNATRHGEIRNLVRNALDEISGDFVVGAVIDRLELSHPNRAFDRSSVSGCLRRLSEEGILSIVTQGQGRRPTVYRKKETTN